MWFKLNKYFWNYDYSSDPDNSDPVLVSFNYTNGDSNLLANIPSIEIRPGENLTVTVSPLKAGHVDILANTDQETNVRWALSGQ